MAGMFLVEVIYRLMQALIAKRKGPAFFLFFWRSGKIIGAGPVGDREYRTILGICFSYLIAHALKTSVKNFLFIKVNIKNVCISDHHAAFFPLGSDPFAR